MESEHIILCMASLQDKVRARLGLPEPSAPVNHCLGSECSGCEGYQPQEGGSLCAGCSCAFVDHNPDYLDDDEFSDEDYVSQYGGGEDW